MKSKSIQEYQADVHFALATIIQGITIAFLGTSFAEIIKSPNQSISILTLLPYICAYRPHFYSAPNNGRA